MAYVFTTFLVGEGLNIDLIVLANSCRGVCKKMAEWEDDDQVSVFFEGYLIGGWDTQKEFKKLLKIKEINTEDPEECITKMLEYAEKVSKNEKKAREFLDLFKTERKTYGGRASDRMKWDVEDIVK